MLSNIQKNDSWRAILNIISQIILQGIGVLMAPVYTRLLTPSDYGITAIYTTLVSALSIVIGLQTNGSLNNARVTFAKERQAEYRSSVLMMSFVFFILITTLVILFSPYISVWVGLNQLFVIIICIHSFSSFLLTFFNTYCTVTMQPIRQMIISIIVSLSSAILSVIFVLLSSQESRYFAKILGTAIPTICFGFTIFFIFLVRGKKFYNKVYWQFSFSLCWPLIFHSLAGLILAQSDRIMLKKMIGNEVTGIYSFCYTAAIPISAIWYAMNSAWVPTYYRYMKEKNYDQIKLHASRYMFTFTCLTSGFLMVIPEGLQILAPSTYWSGVTVIPLVILSYYFNFLYAFPANHEFYYAKTRYISIATALSAGINIIMNLLFIPHFSMIGAAIATLVSYIIVFIIHEVVARTKVKNFNYFGIRFYTRGCLPVTIFVILSYVLIGHWLIRWVMGTIIAIVLIIHTYKNKAII